MRILPFSVIVACLSLASCATSGPLEVEEDPSRIIFRESLGGLPNDHATIETAVAQDDVLRLRVRFGGGCAEHDFALYAARVFMESEPVQVSAQLAHNAHGDNCRALLERDLQFDLRPLKEAYQKAYARSGTVVVRLREPGPAGKTVSVRYSF